MADSLPKILEPVYETEEQRAAVKEAVRAPRDHVDRGGRCDCLITREDNDK